MRIFILDDLKGVEEAFFKAGVKYEEGHDIVVARTFDEGCVTVDHCPRFDLWILDNDLGEEKEGYDFLKQYTHENPEKVPGVVLTCSYNTPASKNIEMLFQSFSRFKNK